MKKKTPINSVSRTSACRTRTQSAFTLIELLVVMVIIAILIAILVPAVTLVLGNAEKTRARSNCVSLAMAIQQYAIDYGTMPFADGSESVKLDDTQYAQLIAALCRQDYPSPSASAADFNPRNIKYLEVPDEYSSLGYVDPWGKPYTIVIDGDYNDKVEIGGKTIHAKIAVYSWGKNETDDDGKEDDIVSWREGK